MTVLLVLMLLEQECVSMTVLLVLMLLEQERVLTM